MPFDRKAALDLLVFYRDSGVDAVVDDQPVNHFAEVTETPAPSTAHVTPQPERPPSMIRTTLPPKNGTRVAVPTAAPAPAPDVAAMAAREAARQAGTLDDLRAILENFEGCGLRKTAKQLVFADGNPEARVMFVGEAPGAEEDRAGLPFVGRSGKLLDLMMTAIGLDRTTAYIANIIPWRPPGNRTPTPQESQICLPFILRQIELADPDVLVCLGGPSAQTILGFSDGIRRTRGRWLTFNTGKRDIRAMATFHPAYLLRAPLEKRLAWRDFLAIKQALES
jgi:uracil-DNA glycosylase family 4